jgi:Ser/Thr protein kinase RdoA (MazF antagonist)
LGGPQLLWEAEVDAWNLLGFAFLDGRHADYRPGSPDIAKVVATMGRLASVRCPDLPQLKQAERRWARYVDSGADLALLSGRTLLHTDYNPDNVIIQNETARLIDWAWLTKGAPFIDPACFVVRLVAAGHTPAEAEAWVGTHPGWNRENQRGIDVIAVALSRMWAEIASDEPSSAWKADIATSARAWAEHRHAV